MENLVNYVRDQSTDDMDKTTEDLHSPDHWKFADLGTISQIIEESHRLIDESLKDIPSSDESIQELEKSLKKST